jgi:hypothetical protein
MTLCCDQLGGKMITANATYGCAYMQNTFPPTLQSIDAWISCTGDDYICESALNGYTGLPSNTTSRGVSMGGSGVGGGMMIVMLLLGLTAQMTLNT